MKRKLGVIGGLGTDTAAQFYIEAERLWHAAGQPNYIPFMLENCQAPYALVQSLTNSMDQIDGLCDFLCDAARNLEKGGSTFIVIPCNTAHVHIEKVRASVKTPVLSITEEVARKLKMNHIKTAAILGTAVTRNSEIYDKECVAFGIKTMYPSERDQKDIELIIERALSWKNDKTDQVKLQKVIENVIRNEADVAILACTDLQLCLPKPLPSNVIDSMQTLAEASVERLLVG